MNDEPPATTWQITTSEDAGLAPWHGDLALPLRWRSTIEGDDLPYIVQLELAVENGAPRCQAIRFQVRPGGHPMASRYARSIPIAECIEHAIAAATVRVEERPEGLFIQRGHYADDPKRWRQTRRAARDMRTSDERLREVARVYQAASEKPTRAVMEQCGPCSYSTAARWVGLARARGFLPPVDRKDKR